MVIKIQRAMDLSDKKRDADFNPRKKKKMCLSPLFKTLIDPTGRGRFVDQRA